MKCDIIRDLLPLYCDGLCSEASKQEIEAHVAQCQECRACLTEMKEEAPVPSLSQESETEARVLQGVKKKFSRGRRRAVVFAVAIMLIFSIVLAGAADVPQPVAYTDGLVTAELAVDDYRSVIEAVSIYRQRLYRAMSGKMDLYRSRLEHFQTKFAYLSPENRLREQRQRLADLENAVQNGMNRKLQDERHRLSVYLERFAGLSPLKKLNQGYSYVADKYKKTLTSVEQVQNGDTIYISVTDGTIEADVTGTVKEERIYGEERKL